MSSEVEIQVDNAEENKEVKPPTKCGGIPHPISVFFHFAFKIGALFSYIFLSLFVDYFSLVFILVILFLAADLWTVKNVTGRLLVGLRFWNEIRDDGTNEWIYESLEDKRKISTTEVLIFWVGLLGFPFIWILLGIISIFEISPTSVFLVIIAFILSLPNIYGYLKCAKASRFKLKNMAQGYAENTAKEYAQKAAATAMKEYAKQTMSSFNPFKSS